MKRRNLLAVLAVGCVVLTGPSTAWAGTLDQQQTDSGGMGYALDSAESLAQTFTAGLGGGIDQVDLHLATRGTPTAPLTVQIRNVSGGVPGSTVLASASVPASGVPATAAFVPITFAAPGSVVPGTQYAIVAYSDAIAGAGYLWTSSLASNPYPAGEAFYSTSPPGSWTPAAPQTTTDQAFKTYVATPGPPPNTGQRAAALKKCKKKARKHDWSHKKLKKCKKKANLLPV